VSRPRSSLRSAAAALLALGLLGSNEARADISPPDGFAWLHGHRVRIENVVADHVLVLWPCDDGAQFSLEPYCVLRAGDLVHPNGAIYALPANAVKTAPYRPALPDPRARPNETVIVEPKIELESKFFREDRRVLRPAFDLYWRTPKMVAEGAGVDSAVFVLRIERVGPKGVEARFVRAEYQCRNGLALDLAWARGAEHPPVPSCPVTDDRGQVIPPGDGGPENRGATAELAPDVAPGPTLPVTPRQAIWLGIALSSLGLIGVGLMLRREKPDA
jgi:hypothetical protein